MALRGYLTTYVNLCWGLGQLIGIGVIRAMFQRDDQWSYRIPYALQWMWPPFLIIGIALAPESPWVFKMALLPSGPWLTVRSGWFVKVAWRMRGSPSFGSLL